MPYWMNLCDVLTVNIMWVAEYLHGIVYGLSAI